MKPLGEPGRDVDYARANVNFAGDCMYFLQRHFVDGILPGREFESNGSTTCRRSRSWTPPTSRRDRDSWFA
jgi:hypothetical protein